MEMKSKPCEPLQGNTVILTHSFYVLSRPTLKIHILLSAEMSVLVSFMKYIPKQQGHLTLRGPHM